jgi:hypothetical protein
VEEGQLMSFYCYRNDKGERIERQYPMGKAPQKVRVGGRGVFVRDAFAEMRTQEVRIKDGINVHERRDGNIRSLAMGVHPDQIPAAKADAARKVRRCSALANSVTSMQRLRASMT